MSKSAGFVSFDALPTQASKVMPLIVAIAKAASRIQPHVGHTSSGLTGLIEELLLAHALRQDGEHIAELVKQLPMCETVRATERLIRCSVSDFSWPKRQEAARYVLPYLRPPVMASLDRAFHDKSLLQERSRVYLVHAHSRLGDASITAGELAGLVTTNAALTSLIEEIADRPEDSFHGVVLLDLFPNPRAFIERIRELNDSRFKGYLAFLESVPPDSLTDIENSYPTDQSS